MRLAYLDDEFTCEWTLGPFKADHFYKVRSTTVAVRRRGEKINLVGNHDDFQ